MNAPDYILVVQVKAGNEHAFTVLYNKYFNKLLYSIIKKYSSLQYDLIEDAVLETFMVFNENIISGKYKHNDSLFSYLYQVAFFKLAKDSKNIKENNNEDFLENLIGQIFENEYEKELYLNLVEEILKNLSIGKKDQNIKCKILFDAQLTNLFNINDRGTKISDEDLFKMYPDVFKSVSVVKNRRNKCLEKLKKEFFKKKEVLENE